MTNTKTFTLRDLKKEIQDASGKSIDQLCKIAKRSTDLDGLHKSVKIKSGLSLVWIAIKNYGQGIKNGYGAGLYAEIRNCGLAVSKYKILSA